MPHFPLPFPYCQRMIGFGCPDVTVPKDYLGPRRGVWQAPPPGITNEQLDAVLQAGLDENDASDAAAIARLDCYDLSHQSLGPGSSGAMHRAAMVWKSPARRKAIKSLLLAHAQLDDSCVRTLAKLVAQAPTFLAPLSLTRFVLDDNDIWGGAFGKLLEAFGGNVHASVQKLEANNCHVGAIAGAETKKDTTAEMADAVVAAPPPADDSPATPRTLASQAAAAALTAAAARAATAFTPLIPFLSAPHCRLQVLSLVQCSITDVMVAYLAEGLRGNHTLIELHLADNSIGDAGARLIAQALGGKRTEEAAAEAAAIAMAAAAAAQAVSEAAAAAAAAALAEDPKAAASARSTSRNGTRASPAVKAAAAAPSHTKSGSSLSGGPKTPLAGEKKNLSFGIGSGASGKDSHRDGATAGDGDVSGSPDHAPSFLLPSFPPHPSTNSTLRILDLSANRMGVGALQHLLSMARLHRALRRCDVKCQRGVASFNAGAMESLEAEIDAALLVNASRSLRETKLAFAIGLHPRAGAHAGMRALVEGARVLAGSLEGGGPQGSGLSTAQTSRTQSRQTHIPALTLHASDEMARAGSSQGMRADGLGSHSGFVEPASPTSVLIRSALAQVWEYVGLDL